MPESCYELAGTRVFECAAEGVPLRSVAAALEFMSAARSHKASLLAIPVARLSDDFFRLRSGLAGEVIQKFVTYGLQLAVIGDISDHVKASAAFRDFVYESNKGGHVWFVNNVDELATKLRYFEEEGTARS